MPSTKPSVIVPFAVEVVPRDVHLGQFVIADFDPCFVGVGIELGLDRETGLRGRTGDEIDDGFVADQSFAAPVLRDEAEETVLDLVPLARAGREMAYGQLQPRLIGQVL